MTLLVPRRLRHRFSVVIVALLVWSFAGCSQLVAQQTAHSSQSFAKLAAEADAARNSDQLDRAISLYKQALAVRPSWAEGWFYLGTLHYDRDEFAAAATAFGRVTKIKPDSGTALVMLGLSEFQLKQDDAALKHLQAGEEFGISDNPELRRTVLLDEAILLQRQSRFEAARTPLDILCQQNSANEEAIRLLGLIQLRLRPDQAAGADAGMLARVGTAGCLAAQKKLDQARAEFSSVVNDYSKFPDIHYAFGNFLLDVPDIPAARQEFEREISNQPNHLLSRLKIASALYRTDSSAGIPYAEQAIKLDPKVALGHYMLGLLLLDVDEYQRAIPELEKAKTSFADEPKLFFALGSAYARAGRAKDAERARAEFQRLQKLQAEKEQKDKRRAEEKAQAESH